MSSSVVITARAVSRRFGDAQVLRDVDVDVCAGQVLGLIGPNGGGKSTLLLILAGLVRPSTGEVRIEGLLAHDLALQAAGRVGLVTAEPGLYPLLTGWENLDFFGQLLGLTLATVRERGAALAERLSLTARELDRPAGSYSSGMRQKLSLVRALLSTPRALLLDEATANLDPTVAWTLYDAIREQADAGVAVVLCTHDLHAAESLCERIIALRTQVVARVEQGGQRVVPRPSPLLAYLGQGRGE